MKTYVLVIACLVVIGCGMQQHFAKPPLERDTQNCAMGVVVPNNVRPDQRAHYINDVAVPACLRAIGYDVTPEPWP